MNTTQRDNAKERRAGPAQDAWLNPARERSDRFPLPEAHRDAVADASARLQRFAPLLSRLFPELQEANGIIESPLLDGAPMAESIGLDPRQGRLLVKADHLLPVAGSIKARGGIYAVLAYAEDVARRSGLLAQDNFTLLASPNAKRVFQQYTLAVGSTGNLGLSVGTMAAALGFRTIVHMSSEAKGWKKERLLRLGVEVIEHAGDYESALAAGRADCAGDPNAFFVDDEDSLPLLYGYATAIERLKRQMDERAIRVDHDHPLFVYVPCGVGGAPAGIALGLRLAFGSAAHCFFAEPVEAPCVLVAMTAPKSTGFPSVYDVGLSGKTEADGLAVPRASRCAVDIAAHLVSGIFTVSDNTMLGHLALAYRALGTRLEPSAAAGFSGPASLQSSEELQRYIAAAGLENCMSNATHLVWATGGRLIPDELFRQMIARAA